MKALTYLLTWWICMLERGRSFQPLARRALHDPPFNLAERDEPATISSRMQFMKQSVMAVTALVLASGSPAYARGRATLDQAYDRYTPRVIAGGQFYKNDLRDLVAKNDFQGIKRALAEPPKKSKEDRSKSDGGTQARAAQAGGFSDARVLVAADLFAATFSDNSVSAKTKKMKEEVENLRSVVQKMQSIAKQATGEESGGGGFFGIGAKKASKEELSKQLKALYVEGGNAYNRYIFAANDGLPVQLTKLPYL